MVWSMLRIDDNPHVTAKMSRLKWWKLIALTILISTALDALAWFSVIEPDAVLSARSAFVADGNFCSNVSAAISAC